MRSHRRRCTLPRNSCLLKTCGLLVLSAVALWTFLPEGSLQDLAAFQKPRCPQDDDAVRLGAGSMDASERYSVHRSVAEAEAEELQLEAGPCLALHSSLGAAHHVVLQASLWNASVSHAVFVAPQDKDAAVAAFRHLRRCFPVVRQRVTFHVVYPLAADVVVVRAAAVAEEEPCSASSPEDALRRLETREPDHELQYPQNLMRNVARGSCRGLFAVTADVDMLPPGDGLLARRLRTFLASAEAIGCHKCAFTLPVFEVDASVARIPRDKEDLRALAAVRKARPFHWGFFRENQRALEPYRWLRAPDGDDASSYGVAFAVTFEFGLEPVFVAARGAPPFDEAFVGFGFTRNTQAYEMILAGWRFVVLDDAFLVHQGFQSLKQRPRWRFEESAHNAAVFRRWLRKVAVAYDSDPLRLLQEYGVQGAAIQLHHRNAPARQQA